VPNEAIIKNPTLTTQQKANGQLDNNRCNDSAVAQQLIAAKAIKARSEKNFK